MPDATYGGGASNSGYGTKAKTTPTKTAPRASVNLAAVRSSAPRPGVSGGFGVQAYGRGSSPGNPITFLRNSAAQRNIPSVRSAPGKSDLPLTQIAKTPMSVTSAGGKTSLPSRMDFAKILSDSAMRRVNPTLSQIVAGDAYRQPNAEKLTMRALGPMGSIASDAPVPVRPYTKLDYSGGFVLPSLVQPVKQLTVAGGKTDLQGSPPRPPGAQPPLPQIAAKPQVGRYLLPNITGKPSPARMSYSIPPMPVLPPPLPTRTVIPNQKGDLPEDMTLLGPGKTVTPEYTEPQLNTASLVPQQSMTSVVAGEPALRPYTPKEPIPRTQEVQSLLQNVGNNGLFYNAIPTSSSEPEQSAIVPQTAQKIAPQPNELYDTPPTGKQKLAGLTENYFKSRLALPLKIGDKINTALGGSPYNDLYGRPSLGSDGQSEDRRQPKPDAFAKLGESEKAQLAGLSSKEVSTLRDWMRKGLSFAEALAKVKPPSGGGTGVTSPPPVWNQPTFAETPRASFFAQPPHVQAQLTPIMEAIAAKLYG